MVIEASIIGLHRSINSWSQTNGRAIRCCSATRGGFGLSSRSLYHYSFINLLTWTSRAQIERETAAIWASVGLRGVELAGVVAYAPPYMHVVVIYRVWEGQWVGVLGYRTRPLRLNYMNLLGLKKDRYLKINNIFNSLIVIYLK